MQRIKKIVNCEERKKTNTKTPGGFTLLEIKA